MKVFLMKSKIRISNISKPWKILNLAGSPSKFKGSHKRCLAQQKFCRSTPARWFRQTFQKILRNWKSFYSLFKYYRPHNCLKMRNSLFFLIFYLIETVSGNQAFFNNKIDWNGQRLVQFEKTRREQSIVLIFR